MSPAARNSARARGSDAGGGDASGALGYFERSRSIAESVLAIAPLLILYEVGLAATQSPVANGADMILRRAFLVLGPRYGPLLWHLMLVAAFVASAVVVLRRQYPILRDLPVIAAEGLAYGALLGPAALWVQRRLGALLAIQGTHSESGAVMDAALALGAGVYEELLFRLLGLSAIYYVARRTGEPTRTQQVASAVIAVVASAVLFSAFHHWPGGEPFHAAPFVFRCIAGCALGALFIARGLGIAVYTHAAYDLLVTFWH